MCFFSCHLLTLSYAVLRYRITVANITPNGGQCQVPYPHLGKFLSVTDSMTDNEERERGARLVAFAKDRYGGVRQMAEQSDTPEKSLRRYCTGERSIPVEVLAAVVADGGSADWIVSGKGAMYANTENLDQQQITIEWIREALREKLKAQAVFQEDQKGVAVTLRAIGGVEEMQQGFRGAKKEKKKNGDSVKA